MTTTCPPRDRLVVGLGSELCGDDAFGPAVVAALRLDPEVVAAADVVDAGTDLLGWVLAMARYRRVLLLDAMLASAPSPAGTLRLYGGRELERFGTEAASGHQLSPLVAVRLLPLLAGSRPPEVELLGWAVPSVGLRRHALDARVVGRAVAATRRWLELRPRPRAGPGRARRFRRGAVGAT